MLVNTAHARVGANGVRGACRRVQPAWRGAGFTTAARLVFGALVVGCRVLQAATEVLHKALNTLHMKAEVRNVVLL